MYKGKVILKTKGRPKIECGPELCNGNDASFR
jgi:hypothetical protein